MDTGIKFSIWKIVDLRRRSDKTLSASLRKKGFQVSVGPQKFLRDPGYQYAPDERRIEKLVRVAAKDFGFKQPPSYKKFLGCAEETGLKKCLPITAFHLRLDYPGQPKGEILTLAMDPVSRSRPILLTVGYYMDGLWVREEEYIPGFLVSLNREFVFSLDD